MSDSLIIEISALVISSFFSAGTLWATIYFAKKVNKLSEANLAHTEFNTQIAFLGLNSEDRKLLSESQKNLITIFGTNDSKEINEQVHNDKNKLSKFKKIIFKFRNRKLGLEN